MYCNKRSVHCHSISPSVFHPATIPGAVWQKVFTAKWISQQGTLYAHLGHYSVQFYIRDSWEVDLLNIFDHRVLFSYNLYYFCKETTLRKTCLPEVHWQCFHACGAGICHLQYVCTRNGMQALGYQRIFPSYPERWPWPSATGVTFNHIPCKWDLSGRPERPERKWKAWCIVLRRLATTG